MSDFRFSLSLTISIALHGLLGLLLYFDVVGAGGGFGIGSGPGFGIGQGGGFGLGMGKKRQIFALKDLAAEETRPRKGKVEDRLAAALQPQAMPRSAMALAGDLAIAVPKPVALPPTSPQIHSDLERKAASGALAFGGLGGSGGGGGLGVSLGGAFGRYVSDLREKGLDVVFVIDGTASMDDVIDAVRRDLGALVDTIQGMVPVARIGFVVYRDRSDDKPIEMAPLTASRKKLAAFLQGVRAEGGGDWPESLNLGIGAAWEKMQWRPGAKRLIVFVAGSPPHDDERAPTIALAREVHEAGGAVSAVDLSAAMHEAFEREFAKSMHGREPDAIPPLPDFYREVEATFREIVAAGGGELIEFRQDDTLVKHLLVLAFGTRWKEEVKALAQAARPQD
jgi:hypothetical protein